MLIWAQREIQLFGVWRPYYHKGKRLSDRRNGHMTNTILISNDNIDDCCQKKRLQLMLQFSFSNMC